MSTALLGMMRSGLFNGLDNDTIRRLLKRVDRIFIEPGEWVFREGEIPDSFYIVLTGGLEIITHADDGDEVPLGALESGDFFGEQGSVTRKQRPKDGQRSRRFTPNRSDEVWR